MDERIAKKNAEVKKMLNSIPRGKPKSGKTWKETRKNSHTELKIGSLRTSFEEKMKKRAERKSVKDFEKRLKDEKMKELAERRQKMKEKRERKLENERKNEIVTIIKNPAKIRKTKKKLLRSLKPKLK